MNKILDLGTVSDKELLRELKLRGYFVREISILECEPIPSRNLLKKWEATCGETSVIRFRGVK